ncbi:hypothetical protein BpHYR1_047393 [Brachionus plicatilis]|uniref:Uncharacterized protein n=1 Tax=Brachionus plicatilis TaxID=10195 RepID=A0A3M7T664_BRAPC|nr:hypothetical protein BpHYR1_047393 [Brachionus plicatilis]
MATAMSTMVMVVVMAVSVLVKFVVAGGRRNGAGRARERKVNVRVVDGELLVDETREQANIVRSYVNGAKYFEFIEADKDRGE